jgi:hypothetical protein
MWIWTLTIGGKENHGPVVSQSFFLLFNTRQWQLAMASTHDNNTGSKQVSPFFAQVLGSNEGSGVLLLLRKL